MVRRVRVRRGMTQNEIVRAHLELNGTISTWDAFELYGITRLSARIADLKEQGVEFTRKWVTKRNRYGDLVSYLEYGLAA